MLRRATLEILVGLFMLAGVVAFVVLALKVSGLTSYTGKHGYYLKAKFDNIGGLKIRAPVTIGGVRIGDVTNIELDPTTFAAVVTMQINAEQNKIPKSGTEARILTQGLLGSNYISIRPGYADNNNASQYLHNGGMIEETQPAIILENLISQLVFSNDKKK